MYFGQLLVQNTSKLIVQNILKLIPEKKNQNDSKRIPMKKICFTFLAKLSTIYIEANYRNTTTKKKS